MEIDKHSYSSRMSFNVLAYLFLQITVFISSVWCSRYAFKLPFEEQTIHGKLLSEDGNISLKSYISQAAGDQC